MTTKDEVRSTVEALKMALKLALEALEETRNALAWFYDSYPEDVTPKGNELLPHVEVVLADLRVALTSNSRALEQPAQQEPVACVIDGDLYFHHEIDWEDLAYQGHGVELLYTRPQPAAWVELTDEERSYYLQSASNVGWWQAAKFIEAKLREKNGGKA